MSAVYSDPLTVFMKNQDDVQAPTPNLTPYAGASGCQLGGMCKLFSRAGADTRVSNFTRQSPVEEKQDGNSLIVFRNGRFPKKKKNWRG